MLRNRISAAARMFAAFTFTAATRAVVVREDDNPSAVYAGQVQMYERTAPSIFVDYYRGYDNFRDMEHDADAIVVARMRSSKGDEAAPSQIGAETLYTLDVSHAFKGSVHAGDDIVVRQPGGIAANGNVQMVSGDPPFEPGMTYLLFLEDGPDGYSVLGGAAGRLVLLRGRLYALSVVYHDKQIFDTGANGVSIDLFSASLGLANANSTQEAVIPDRDYPYVPTRPGDEIG